MGSPNWSDEDIQKLRDGWARGDIGYVIAEAVGRTSDLVYKQAKRIGLTKRPPTHASRRVWTEEKDERLIQLRAEGKRIEEIAAEMNCTRSSIASRIRKLHVPYTPPNRDLPQTQLKENAKFDWTTSAVETLKKLWAEGHSKGEIGRRLGISRNSVTGKVMRLNLPSRILNNDKKPEPRKISPRVYAAPKKPEYVPRLFRPTFGEPCCFASETGENAPGKRWRYCDAPATFGPYCAEHAAGLYIERKSNREVRA